MENYREMDDLDGGASGVRCGSKRIATATLVFGILSGVLLVCTIGLGVAYGMKGTETPEPPGPSYENKTCLTRECLQTASTMMENMNSSADPCQDFYAYACDHYPWHNKMDPTEDRLDPVIQLYESNEEDLQRFLSMPIARGGEDSWERKVKAFFSSCMTLDADSATPGLALVDMIDSIGGWNVLDPANNASWGSLHDNFVKLRVDMWTSAFYDFDVVPSRNTTGPRQVIRIYPGGLGYEYKYYVGNETSTARELYLNYMEDVATMLARDSQKNFTGDTKLDARIKSFVYDVVHFEGYMANLFENTKWGQPVTYSLLDLDNKFHQLPWSTVFMSIFNEKKGVKDVTEDTKVYVMSNSYFSGLNKMLEDLENITVVDGTRVVNNYMVWRLIQNYIDVMPYEYQQLKRDFIEAATGAAQTTAMEKRCLQLLQRHIPILVSALYVQNRPSRPSRVTKLVDQLQVVMSGQINGTTWMDDATKKYANAKLANLKREIGQPAKYFDDNYLDDLYIDAYIIPINLLTNVMSAVDFNKKQLRDFYRNGRNTDVWDLSTYDVSPRMRSEENALMAPAGGIHHPIFVHRVPPYINYGSYGSMLAKEMVHVADEYGSRHGINGNRTDWWSQETYFGWMARKSCFSKYYDGFMVGPVCVDDDCKTVRIKGDLVATDAMAETSSIIQAVKAYENYRKRIPVLDLVGFTEFTHHQILFLNYAQTKCQIMTDVEAYRSASDRRLPHYLRVNGALAHVPEFAKAFNCPAGSPMVADPTCVAF